MNGAGRTIGNDKDSKIGNFPKVTPLLLLKKLKVTAAGLSAERRKKYV
jgi:hypothetical protein